MVKRFIYLLVVFSFVVSLTGCANPAYFRRTVQFVPINWSRVAVLPFTGDIRFTQVATDTFNLHLLKQNDFIVLEPSTIEVAMNKIVVRENSPGSFTILEAQKIGRLVNAEAVFLGNITSYYSGLTLNAFATVKLIDTKSGKVIAVSHKPSGLIMAFSEHQCAVKAVERVAKDMLKALKDLASKNEMSQPTKKTKSPSGLSGSDI